LRQGTIIWEGFSPGRRQLAAVASLQQDEVAARFPVGVSITPTGAGVVSVVVTNSSTLAVAVADGVPDAAALSSGLDAARVELRAGRFPRTGLAGLPMSIPGTVGATPVSVQVTPTVVLGGEIRFGDGSSSPVAGPLGAGGRLEATGRAPAELHLTVEFQPPVLADLAADVGTEAGRRQALRALQTVIATGLRIRDYGPYIAGVERAVLTTSFTTRPAAAAAPPPPPGPDAGVDILTVALSLLSALALLAVALAARRTS
jgi:hypothetical protein